MGKKKQARRKFGVRIFASDLLSDLLNIECAFHNSPGGALARVVVFVSEAPGEKLGAELLNIEFSLMVLHFYLRSFRVRL